MVSAGGELGGQRFADVLRGTGDDGTGIRAGGGYWHGPDYIVGDHERIAAARANRGPVAGAGVGTVGLRLHRGRRDRRDLRVLRLPDRSVGDDLPGDTSPASWLGWALFFSGVTVALLAPVTGVWVDAPHRRRRTLAVLTAMVVLLTSAMSLIRDDASYLLAGLLLLGFTAACNDLASVPYNAMLRQLSTPETSGRVSGFGWAAGYFGSVVLLLVVYSGFIAGDGPTVGLLDIPTPTARTFARPCW